MSNITIIIIEKNGTVKELTVKNFDENELYKKAGFKTSDTFKSHTEWNIDNLNGVKYAITVYGKTSGRANQENKYEFPPPVDNILFFGSCVLVNRSNDQPKSLRISEWNSIYDHLYGGFEDLEGGMVDKDEVSVSSEEETDLPLTKFGYAKDGFVVDDNDVDEDCYETEEDEEDEIDDDGEYAKKKKAKKPTKKSTKSATNSKPSSDKVDGKNIVVIPTAQVDDMIECTSELSEESYI